MLAGMAVAHGAGIIHRDLKSANLLVSQSDDGSVTALKILDIGLAKVRESAFADPKSRTRAGVATGMFGYMSPERVLGSKVDERTDVYAMGVIALEVLSGSIRLRNPQYHREILDWLEARLGGSSADPRRPGSFRPFPGRWPSIASSDTRRPGKGKRISSRPFGSARTSLSPAAPRGREAARPPIPRQRPSRPRITEMIVEARAEPDCLPAAVLQDHLRSRGFSSPRARPAGPASRQGAETPGSPFRRRSGCHETPIPASARQVLATNSACRLTSAFERTALS